MAAIIKEGIIAVGVMVNYTDYTIHGISDIVTDNASAIDKAWIILKNDYPTLIVLPCLVYILHLVFKDVLRYNPSTSVVNSCLKVTEYFYESPSPEGNS